MSGGGAPSALGRFFAAARRPTLRSPPGSPPAIWVAFARQGRWKSWVLASQQLALFFLLAICLHLARRPPDVVVVGEDGSGAYVPAHTAGGALVDFLREQRGRATGVTLLAFARRFVRLVAAVNSTTVDEAWDEATSLMVAPLAARARDEARAQRLLETYRLAQVRTALDFEALDVVERRGDKAHVRVRVRRHKEKLMGGGQSYDALQLDLILLDVPRTPRTPDGLAVLDWRSAPAELSTPAVAGETP